MKNKIDIVKALGIILVVMAHSCSPMYVSRFSYMLCVSIFFICSGFCFNTKYLSDQTTFIRKRLTGLYVPFWKWSVFFLLLNHFWFYVGILSEKYGNVTGGVQHPLKIRAWFQSLWSITFNMSGYDQFLCGAYWFFRALMIVSILWIVLMSLLNAIRPLREKYALCAILVGVAAIVVAWQHCYYGLSMTGVAQGGFRELMGLYFFALGFVARQSLELCRQGAAVTEASAAPVNSKLSVTLNQANRLCSASIRVRLLSFLQWINTHRTICTLIAFAGIALLVCYYPVSMSVRMKKAPSILVLALSGILGFFLISGISCLIDRYVTGRIKRAIIYIGQNTLYIFGFHIFSFKIVSIAIVLCYNLEWGMVGEHPVIFHQPGHWWILYTITGVAFPLLINHCIRARIDRTKK